MLSNYYRDILLNRLESEITRVALVSNASVASDILDISTLREVGRVTPTFEQIENSLQITANFNDSTANCVETYITGSITANSFVVNSASGLGIGDLIFVNDIDYTIQNVSGSTITTTQNFILIPQVNDIVRKYINQIHYVKNGTDTANSGETAFCKNYRTFKISPQAKKITTLITLSVNIKIENFVSTAYTSLDTPLNLTVFNVTKTNATFTWNNSIGATSYNLYILNTDDMLYLDNLGNTHISPTPYQNTALLTLTATNLSENTNYSAFISAQNTAGESALSSAENFKTWQEVIFYASNKTTRSYVYKTNYAKSFDTKLTAQTTYLEAQFTIGAISPNGRYFSYDADVTTTNNAIMLYDFELNTVTTLVNDGNINRYPVWKPDDPDHVYFTENTGVVVLKKVNINTLTVTSLRTFSGTNESCRYIRFTPDSSRLYIQYQATTTTIQSIAWIDTSDYNGSLNIIFSNSTNGILEFNINKAGTKICFSAVTGANQQLFDMNLDGSSLTQRTTGANNKSCPIYSPDDSKILFRLVIGSDSIIYQCDNTYDGITGYFENQAVWLNNTGNLTEFPLAWGTISSLALSVPQNLTVTNTTIDSASFEWDLVTGASRYKLYIGLLPNQGDLLPSYNGLDIGNVDNFTTSNDLPPGQTLYVSVKAVNNYTESDFSSEQTFNI